MLVLSGFPSANQAQSERSSATGARDKLAGSETLGVRTIEAESWRGDRPVSLSKMVTNSVMRTDVIGWTCELHYHLLRCGSYVEVHVFAFSLQFSFLEAFASVQDWMFFSTKYIRDLSCKFVSFSFLGYRVYFFTLSSLFWTWTNKHYMKCPGFSFPE